MDSCPDTDIDPKFLPLSQYTHTHTHTHLCQLGATYIERGLVRHGLQEFGKGNLYPED